MKNFCEDLFFFFFGDRLKNFCKDLFLGGGRALALVFLVLGLDHSCSRPRECLSSERLSLASDFFVSLASSLESSTPPLVFRGGLGPWPPFGLPGLQNCTEK